jgi:sugar phosphate permease
VVAVLLGWPLARMFRRGPEELGETVDGLPASPTALAEQAARSAHPGESAAPGTGTTTAGAEQIAAPLMAISAAEPIAPLAPPDATSATPEKTAQGTPPAPAPREFTAREAVRTRAFWLLSIGHAFALLVVSAVNVHAISHMSSGLGYTIAQASLVITLMTFAQTGGVMLGWTIGDRVDKRKVAAACMLMHASGLLLLTFAANVSMLVAFALLHGTAWGLRGPFMQAIRADYFGRRAIGMILGLSAALIAVGQVLGPMVAGALADITGDYRIGFTVLALVAAVGSVAFMQAKRPV